MISPEKQLYIRNMESRTMGAWPSFQTIIDDGWVLRFAKGYTKRANSVNPIFPSTDNISEKIFRCETQYSQLGLPCVFKLTKIASPFNLEEFLDKRGYSKIDETSVQEVSLLNDFNSKSRLKMDYFTAVNETWLKHYCHMNRVSEQNQLNLKGILTNIVTPAFYVLLYNKNECVACGLGVQDGIFIGLFDIVVAKNHRNQGIGTQLIQYLLELGKNNGAQKAYLQVMLNNPAALHLYEKLGFQEQYRYWYRKK
ncbi:hypothetical protein NEF87_002385 [Candidatus Lokiarchaeum ossiferum]|uniref:N-acetyltransferase domain-containing protein n=1 Tax=Candidatus Lokiarchaeum ossiferum TaxID=2951803 RepID=A0ABY6HRS0_9ARCH|nr:hypothetical protein NEF87_002385 [Candidatus Lokiarchaeum sp. B-35]